MAKVTVELACVEMVIEQDIKAGFNQTEVAKTYALALRSSWPTDLKAVNQMIIERWSAAGLNRIKKMAHSGSCFAKPHETN